MELQTKPLSASCLKSLAKSPEHCYANHLDPNRERTESDAMQLGSLIHCMILEPEMLHRRYVKMPEGMVRRGAKWDDFKVEAKSLSIVKSSIWQKAEEAVSRVKKDDMAASLLQGRKRSVQKEEQVSWIGYADEMRVHYGGYIDLVNHTTRRIVDIKTTSNADNLSKLASDGRWDIQAAQYIDAMSAIRDERYRMFFLVVEVNSPFRIRAVELSPDALRAGRKDRTRLTKEFMDRLERNDWSGGGCVSELDMPAWFSRTLENVNEQC